MRERVKKNPPGLFTGLGRHQRLRLEGLTDRLRAGRQKKDPPQELISDIVVYENTILAIEPGVEIAQFNSSVSI